MNIFEKKYIIIPSFIYLNYYNTNTYLKYLFNIILLSKSLKYKYHLFLLYISLNT
jgi:hypothetical protein